MYSTRLYSDQRRKITRFRIRFEFDSIFTIIERKWKCTRREGVLHAKLIYKVIVVTGLGFRSKSSHQEHLCQRTSRIVKI